MRKLPIPRSFTAVLLVAILLMSGVGVVGLDGGHQPEKASDSGVDVKESGESNEGVRSAPNPPTTQTSASYDPHFYHTGINYYSHRLDINGLGWENIRSVLCNSSQVPPDDAGNCTQVYYYNSTTHQWQIWDINKPDSENTLINASSGYGYLVNVTKVGDMNLIDPGDAIINAVDDPAWGTMQPGWNLMGWTDYYNFMYIINAVPLIKDKWDKKITRVWNYANNTDIMEPYWPENSSAQFHPAGANTTGIWVANPDPAYWVYVEDSSNRGSGNISEPPLMPWQDKRPVLSNGSVDVSAATSFDTLNLINIPRSLLRLGHEVHTQITHIL